MSFIAECTAFQPLSASRNLEASLLILDLISVSFNLGCLYFCQYSSFKNVVCVLCLCFQLVLFAQSYTHNLFSDLSFFLDLIISNLGIFDFAAIKLSKCLLSQLKESAIVTLLFQRSKKSFASTLLISPFPSHQFNSLILQIQGCFSFLITLLANGSTPF